VKLWSSPSPILKRLEKEYEGLDPSLWSLGRLDNRQEIMKIIKQFSCGSLLVPGLEAFGMILSTHLDEEDMPVRGPRWTQVLWSQASHEFVVGNVSWILDNSMLKRVS